MATMIALHKNLSLRDALRAAVERGCTVTPRSGTGESIIAHATIARRLTVNIRRKDTPQALIAFLRKLEH